MSLPEHLEAKTYWEKRAALLEEAVRRLVDVLRAHALPPSARYEIQAWAAEWDRILDVITREESPPPEQSAASPLEPPKPH